MDYNIPKPLSQILQESAATGATSSAEAERGWTIPEEISTSLSQHSQNFQQSRISLSTEEEHENEECEEEEHEHSVKRRKKSKVWEHFTHPAKVKGMVRSTCNHCRYFSTFISIVQVALHMFLCFLTLALQNVIGHG